MEIFVYSDTLAVAGVEGWEASKALVCQVTGHWSRGMIQDIPVSAEYSM